jgi:hypothetical protein
MTRPTRYLRALLLITSILLSGCLEFESIEQPSSILPGELFTVRIAATAATTEGVSTQPYFGICLPLGWTIPGDAFSYTGVSQGTIRYDPNLSLEQENLSPAREGYYWWVGDGNDVNTEGGAVFGEVPIQTDLQTGRYSLDYLLAPAPGGGGLPNAQRSDNHIIDVVNEFTPRELNTVIQGNSVVLTWLPPMRSEGLAGYRVYRDGQLIHTGPAETTEVLDENLAAGVFYYSVSAVRGSGDEQLTPYEVKALIFSGGTGEPNDPYQIATAADLIALGENPEDYDKHFILTADIDLDPNLPGRKVFDKAVVGPDMDSVKDYYQGTPFTGVFDGNGHAILHLTVTGGGYVGLFGQLLSGADVRNLEISDVNITASGGRVGGLAGENSGTITACHSNGQIRGGDRSFCVGGLVGDDDGGKITQCGSICRVEAGEQSYDLGGLMGENEGTVTDCYSRAEVLGVENVGGLVGQNGGTIANCYSTGSISDFGNILTQGWTGGLVGDNRGSVTHCYSTVSVNGTTVVGGLLGFNNGQVAQCYSTGRVEGISWVGGLVGSNDSDVANCWSTSPVSSTGEIAGGLMGYNGGVVNNCYSAGVVICDWVVGGLVGYNQPGTVNISFWDMQTSGQTASDGGTGKTTAEMQAASTFLGWGSCGRIWTIDEGQGYPHLAWENVPGQALLGSTYAGGAGTAEDPYLIYTAEDLDSVARSVCDWDKHFKLMADIDLSAFDGKDGRPSFNVIGADANNAFTGVFDGNGHTVLHLTIRGKDYVGLFGQLCGEVKNLGVVDVNITGWDYVGGLAANNEGHMTSCYTTGTVRGVGWHTGGLVGQNNDTVTHCYSAATVIGDNCVGGLVGFNDLGRVTNCYSTGVVSGRYFIGGLNGQNPGDVTGCFWDTQTSGQTKSAGGTGKTTAEMQTVGTFLEAGWDFVGETANGTEDIWWIDEGKDYPRLWWETHDN